MTISQSPIPKQYWEQRAQGGKIYGDEQSFSAQLALQYLKKGQRILEIGGAYGRNSTFFAKNGMRVINSDLSPTWIAIANADKKNLSLTNICGDVLLQDFNKKFDAAFSNFVLHFFRDNELKTLLQKVSRIIKPNGWFINSWLSSNDMYASTGYHNGLYIHCYTGEELKALHEQNGFQFITCLETIELETVNAADRKTFFWFTAAKRK